MLNNFFDVLNVLVNLIAQERIEGAVGGLGVSAPSPILSTKLSPSPKRFAKQDLVYLSEIESIEELSDLSATQLKKLLAMNRVTFKGVVEKEELLKIVTRLWKQEQKAEEGEYNQIFYFDILHQIG